MSSIDSELPARSIADGRLRAPAVKAFPLEETNAALSEMAAGHARGKLVIVIR